MLMPQDTRAAIAAKLNEFPEVEWDRCAGTADYGVAFGWIARDDSRSDFLVLHWWMLEDGLAWASTTSSAAHSQAFAVRLGVEHSDCERVEDEFPAVTRRIHVHA